jgi:hypothetical protein
MSTIPSDPMRNAVKTSEDIARVAHAIAAEIARQDYGDWKLNEDLTVDYLDQGTVDFSLVAKAALTATPAPEPQPEVTAEPVAWQWRSRWLGNGGAASKAGLGMHGSGVALGKRCLHSWKLRNAPSTPPLLLWRKP